LLTHGIFVIRVILGEGKFPDEIRNFSFSVAALVIISNYTNAMEKQNFRMNSGNFAVPYQSDLNKPNVRTGTRAFSRDKLIVLVVANTATFCYVWYMK